MKLFYLANIRFPTERAHGVQVAHMCEALGKTRIDAEQTRMNAETSLDVTLVVPDRKTMAGDLFDYYGIRKTFTIEKVPVIDWVRFGRLGFLIESLSYALCATTRVRQVPDALVYSRELLPLLFLFGSGHRTIFEGHTAYRNRLERYVLSRCARIVAISEGLKKYYTDELGIPDDRIMVAPDGVDLDRFSVSVTKEEARLRLGLPIEAKIAMYIGGLESWKGVETLFMASDKLQEEGIAVVVIGGTPASLLREYGEKYKKVTFLGELPYRDLPINQRAADVLVIPNSQKEDISRLYTSPLKLFAHMASGVPIVASDLPSIREILTENSAVLVPPDDPQALTMAICKLAYDHEIGKSFSIQASENVEAYTWEVRARKMVDMMLVDRLIS